MHRTGRSNSLDIWNEGILLLELPKSTMQLNFLLYLPSGGFG